MKIRRRALIGMFSFVAVLGAAESDIEFAGVLTAEGKTRIALTDKIKKTTTWVQPGEKFHGYTVARYDEKEEAVFLNRNGQEKRLPLIAAKSAESPPATPEASNATAQVNAAITAAVRANLRQLASAARQYQMERGVNSVGYSELVGPDKTVKDLKPIAGENYSTLNFSPNVTAVSVTTSNGMIITHEIAPAAATSAAQPPLPTVGQAVQTSSPAAVPATR